MKSKTILDQILGFILCITCIYIVGVFGDIFLSFIDKENISNKVSYGIVSIQLAILITFISYNN